MGTYYASENINQHKLFRWQFVSKYQNLKNIYLSIQQSHAQEFSLKKESGMLTYTL